MLTAAAALAAAATIAACGSSSPTGSSSSIGSGSSPTSSMLAFSGCMRANGVPTFPDVNAGTMRIQSTQGPNGQTVSVNGVSVNTPAFQAARQECQKYMPHQQVSQSRTALLRRRLLTFARCMRSHGINNFPDPKITTGPGGGQGVDLRGAGLNFQSPAFQAAQNACGGLGSLKGG